MRDRVSRRDFLGAAGAVAAPAALRDTAHLFAQVPS
ncbi:MAG: twin-arginine translocation signal domain-containing protein [Gemmatimonadales bacterium]